MIVKQEIPDGDFCAAIDHANCEAGTRCIFLDYGSIMCRETANAFVCRRHPNVTLATEAIEPITGKQCVVKCRDCMRDAT
jgi:hypothetical protein